MRLYVGMSFLNVQAILKYINHYNKLRLEKLIKNEPIKSMDIDVDQTMMTTILVGGYVLKISKLIFIIMTVTYYLGMFWFIISTKMYEATREEIETLDGSVYNTETFITDNGLELDNNATT